MKVGTSPLAGAEMMTFLAPPLRCWAALSRSTKNPVDSMTTSAPTSPQGIFGRVRLGEDLDGPPRDLEVLAVGGNAVEVPSH